PALPTYPPPVWPSSPATTPPPATSARSPSTSDNTGPRWVRRTVRVTSSSPATRMVSWWTARSRHSPSTWYRSPSIRSRYRSVTSWARLVKPQAIRSLWPITTPGTPENVNPLTRWPQEQCRPIWYQIPGMLTPRCGSLASNGAPVAVRSPCSTQELEPSPEPASPSSAGTAATARLTAARVSRAGARSAGAGPLSGPAARGSPSGSAAGSPPAPAGGGSLPALAGGASSSALATGGSSSPTAARVASGSNPSGVSAPSVTIGARSAYRYSG